MPASGFDLRLEAKLDAAAANGLLQRPVALLQNGRRHLSVRRPLAPNPFPTPPSHEAI
jgi:hypothetical protein